MTDRPGRNRTPAEVDILRALSHPVRWGILERLAAEPGICACDFTEFFDVSQPTISAHLKVLREAELVTTRRNGTTICYMIAPDQLVRLASRLAAMADTASAEAGSADTASAEAGPADISSAEAGPAETSSAETGPTEAGAIETGPVEAGQHRCDGVGSGAGQRPLIA